MIPQRKFLVLVGLVLLLSVQLTGLSCINDWNHTTNTPLKNLQSVCFQLVSGFTADDGCPCHLAYLSVPFDRKNRNGPMISVDPDTPLRYAHSKPFLPFHPPLTL